MPSIFKYLIGFFAKIWPLKINFLPPYYQLWPSNPSYLVFLIFTLFLKIPFRRFTIYDLLFIFT